MESSKKLTKNSSPQGEEEVNYMFNLHNHDTEKFYGKTPPPVKVEEKSPDAQNANWFSAQAVIFAGIAAIVLFALFFFFKWLFS